MHPCSHPRPEAARRLRLSVPSHCSNKAFAIPRDSTQGADLSSLDERHTIFGEVAEGMDVLERINEAPVDGDERPLQNIR